MNATRAVLFDIGGTLFTYEAANEGRTERYVRIAETLGRSVDEVTLAFHEGMVRSSSQHFAKPYYVHKELFGDAYRYALASLGVEPERVSELIAPNKEVPAGLRRFTPRPGAEETLVRLREMGLHTAAVSNADEDQFDAMIDGLGFRHLFDSLICSETVGSCKPDAKIFLAALESAGCQPHEALFVGDTPDHDIAGAEAVGIRAVLIVEEHGVGFDRGAPRPGQIMITELPELLALL